MGVTDSTKSLGSSSREEKEKGRKKSASIYRGVFRSGNRWKAQIQISGIQHYLGTYDNEEDAKRAYDRKAGEQQLNKGRSKLRSTTTDLSSDGKSDKTLTAMSLTCQLKRMTQGGNNQALATLQATDFDDCDHGTALLPTSSLEKKNLELEPSLMTTISICDDSITAHHTSQEVCDSAYLLMAVASSPSPSRITGGGATNVVTPSTNPPLPAAASPSPDRRSQSAAPSKRQRRTDVLERSRGDNVARTPALLVSPGVSQQQETNSTDYSPIEMRQMWRQTWDINRRIILANTAHGKLSSQLLLLSSADEEVGQAARQSASLEQHLQQHTNRIVDALSDEIAMLRDATEQLEAALCEQAINLTSRSCSR